LVRQVTESRVEAARHANPLTLLPGNIPISEHIERLLSAGADFVCCYADLRNFKPFNDYYGYWRGDEMIKLLARTAQEHCDPQRDFLGHVGGDDFVILFQSADWQTRCAALVSRFNESAEKLYDDNCRDAGGIEAEDRHGVKRFFAFTSLYVGAVPVSQGHRYKGAADVASAAARAKQAAKPQALDIHLTSRFLMTQPGTGRALTVAACRRVSRSIQGPD
jgi:GGDEF domain-containing protein